MMIMCVIQEIRNTNDSCARKVTTGSAPIIRQGSDKKLWMKCRRQSEPIDRPMGDVLFVPQKANLSVGTEINSYKAP